MLKAEHNAFLGIWSALSCKEGVLFLFQELYYFFFLSLQQFAIYLCLLCDPLETPNPLCRIAAHELLPSFYAVDYSVEFALVLCVMFRTGRFSKRIFLSILHTERHNVLVLVYRYVNHIHCTSGWFSVQEECTCICKKFGKKHIIFALT